MIGYRYRNELLQFPGCASHPLVEAGGSAGNPLGNRAPRSSGWGVVWGSVQPEAGQDQGCSVAVQAGHGPGDPVLPFGLIVHLLRLAARHGFTPSWLDSVGPAAGARWDGRRHFTTAFHTSLERGLKLRIGE